MTNDNLDILVSVETLFSKLDEILDKDIKISGSVYDALLELNFLINIIKEEREHNG